MYHVPCYCSQKNSKEDTFSAIGCNCSNVFDYFFHGKRIHHHRDTKLKKTLWGWVDADWDGDREDEGQLPLHHRYKNTGDHLPVIFVGFPVLKCEWTDYSNIDICDKFTHRKISTHTWTSVVNVVKGS